jgi:serine/threonine-protein kinase
MQFQRLGPYEIGEPLGKGGMGSVYVATDTRSGQRVAIKALTPHLATADGFRERFEAEIESLKTLRHDGIVRLFGYGEQDGVLFYSMELVEGTSLEDELKAGRRFNWREVTNIAIQLAQALKHAHDHGVIHRDIKPANVLLFGDDRVKLADFGIARLFGSTQLTTAGGVLGTADYMSPEQADGRPVTNRCDQYSLGGVMYSLLTGRPPFRAKNLPQMLQLQRFADPEPVRRFAPDAPEQLERVVLQLLAKDPAARFPNMQVLARHLQAMYMALSRPAADDFALTGDEAGPGVSENLLDPSLLTARTQAESVGAKSSQAPRTGGQNQADGTPSVAEGASQDAATLAAADSDSLSRARVTLNPKSLTEKGTHSPAEQAAGAAPFKVSRFTTVEEEEDALRQSERRSWLAMCAQAALLVAVLGGMAAVALRLSRPASADDLYGKISEARARGSDSLSAIEPQVAEFLRRFEGDPRAEEVQKLDRQLALDRAERRIQAAGRRGAGSADLLPVEKLYLQAAGNAQESPETAIRTLESLVALYGVPAGKSGEEGSPVSVEKLERQALCVALAERRIESLRRDAARQIKEQLASLQERLDAAERVSAGDPLRGAAMYRAIVDLHQNYAWAADVVGEARRRLEVVQKQN